MANNSLARSSDESCNPVNRALLFTLRIDQIPIRNARTFVIATPAPDGALASALAGATNSVRYARSCNERQRHYYSVLLQRVTRDPLGRPTKVAYGAPVASTSGNDGTLVGEKRYWYDAAPPGTTCPTCGNLGGRIARGRGRSAVRCRVTDRAHDPGHRRGRLRHRPTRACDQRCAGGIRQLLGAADHEVRLPLRRADGPGHLPPFQNSTVPIENRISVNVADRRRDEPAAGSRVPSSGSRGPPRPGITPRLALAPLRSRAFPPRCAPCAVAEQGSRWSS